MFVRLVMLFIVIFHTSIALAEMPVSADEEPESPQSDKYYSAMIKSIDLDRNRWKPFSSSMEAGPWFYDSAGLIRTGRKVIASVTVFPHPMKTEIYGAVFSAHTKIRKIVFETEINCAAQTYRQPVITAYDYYNEILVRHSNPAKEFSPIKKGTTTDTLQKLVCVAGTRKKR